MLIKQWLIIVFQCSVVNFPLLTAALKEYASDSAIDLVAFCFDLDLDDGGVDDDNNGDHDDHGVVTSKGVPWSLTQIM